jgi:hypothetical protein
MVQKSSFTTLNKKKADAKEYRKIKSKRKRKYRGESELTCGSSKERGRTEARSFFGLVINFLQHVVFLIDKVI